MKKRYYVINEENQTSYSAKKEAPEHFITEAASRRRAVELANTDPGKVFYICESVKFADAEVEPAAYKSF